MSSVVETVREPPAFGAGGAGSQWSRPGQDYVRVATVGHEDSTSGRWLVVESGQYLVEIVYQTGNPGQEGRARLGAGIKHTALKLGEQVVVVMVGGNESHGIIVCALNSLKQPLPETVAGIATGAGAGPQRDDQEPASIFTFVRTRAGQIYAVESGADMLLHAGAGMEIKASTVSVAGKMIIGKGFDTPPEPRIVGPEDAGGEEGGSAGVPLAESLISTGTVPPYSGDQDAVIRASDRYQAAPGTDEGFFNYLTQQAAYLTQQAAYITALETALTVVLGSAALAAVEPAITAALTAFNLVPKPGTAPADAPQQVTSEAMSASAVLRVRDSVAE